MISNDFTAEKSTDLPADSDLKERLTILLRQCGLPKNSHINFLSEITGLSYSGARKILEHNRLPTNKKALSGLFSGLSKEVGASENDIRRYLLVGQGLPEKSKEVAQDKPENDRYFIFGNKEFENADSLYISKVILKIEQVCDALCVEEVDDISTEDMDRIRYQVVSYCHKNKISIESPKLTSVITGLIELAKENIDC